MSKTTWISVGVGLVAGAAAFFTFGTASAALFAFSAGATIASAFIGPEQPKNGAIRPDELQINQSAENATIPVIFGTARVTGNFIYVGFDQFRSEAIEQEQEGGKGGGGGSQSQTVGYRYYFPLSYGICMGQIDALIKILGNPGLDVMTSFEGGELALGSTPETFSVSFRKKQGDQEYYEGGTATFYPGSPTQGSATTTDKNHRHVCWVDFPEYRVDGNPTPRTLIYEVRRIPKALDENGNPIANFRTRASENPADPEYNDANPAAVAWEILQNPVWGKGMNPASLDVEGFKQASIYYAARRIGCSMVMGPQTVTQIMGKLRDTFGLWLWWDGQKIRARCLYDRTAAYDYRPKIKAEDVIGSPTFSRPSLNGTSNEIRLEFINRDNNWQAEVATAMDLAHTETVGGVRTQSVDGSEIGTRRAAELLAHAMLRQMAYPSATCQMRVTRNYSGLQPGAFVQFVWDEWRDNGVATTYWRVIDVEDDDQGAEGITLSLMEDIYATAQFTDVELWDDPTGTIDIDDPLTDADLVFGDLTAERLPGTLTPVRAWEPPISVTRGNRRIAILPTREKTYVQSVGVAFSRLGEPDTFFMGTSSLMPINGALVAPIASNTPKICRDPAYEFQLAIYHPEQADRIETATGMVIDAADHFAALTATDDALLLIGNEIFRIGNAEVTAPGVVTIRTFIRAELGTEKQAHAADAMACFFTTIGPTQLLNAGDIPITTAVNFHLTPNTLGNDALASITNIPTDNSGVVYDGRSIRPFPPELYSATRAGNTWTIKIRPRMWDKGAGTRPTIEDDLNAYVSDLTGLSLRFKPSNSTDTVTLPASQNFATPPFAMPTGVSIDSLNYQPDDGSLTGGILTVVATFPSNPGTFSIWQVREGLASSTSLAIPQPA